MGLKIIGNDIGQAFQKYIRAAEEIKKQDSKTVDNAIVDMGGSPDKIHDMQPMTQDIEVAKKAAQSEKEKEIYIKQQNQKIEITKLMAKKFE